MKKILPFVALLWAMAGFAQAETGKAVAQPGAAKHVSDIVVRLNSKGNMAPAVKFNYIIKDVRANTYGVGVVAFKHNSSA